MRLGVIRHFKVDCQAKRFMSSEEFSEWAERYDFSEVFPKKIDLKNISWQRCFSSDLPRAITTAKAAFAGEIITTSDLREVPFSPVFKTKLRLPYVFWTISGRIAWFFNHSSQEEGRRDTQARIRHFFSELEDCEEENILIVCHRFFIHSLQREIRRRGFQGERIGLAKNGELYLFFR